MCADLGFEIEYYQKVSLHALIWSLFLLGDLDTKIFRSTVQSQSKELQNVV